MIFLVQLFLLIQCSCILSASVGKPQGRIVGGHEATPHSHPYLVSLQMRIFMIRMHFCGGTILNERWVLSAAHCVQDSWLTRWIPMDAVVGSHDVDNFDPEAQISTIDKRIKHPLYGGDIGPNDIALLKVRYPFKFTKEIKPAMLPTNYKVSGDQMTLTGWGALRTTVFIPDVPSKLQEVQVTYIPADECLKVVDDIKETYEDNPLDTIANICTGPITGGIAACNGDSGGPLVQFVPKNKLEVSNDAVENLNNEIDINDDDLFENDLELKTYRERKQYEDQENIPVLLGVVSWGVSPCGEKGAPTVYTKVSNYLDFINQYIET